MPFEFERLSIPDVILVRPRVFGDARGFFMETYKASAFREGGIPYDFVQDNHSRSARGVLRGLHYQLEPMEQGKLVRCVRGRIWDVAVDLRRGSPWFAKWVAQELSEENRLMLWIPPGFAHGFVVLSEVAEVIYKVTKEYAPALDRGIIWNDPELGIRWPVEDPVLSPKDASLPPLSRAEINFTYGGAR